jgi:cellulose synthase/poly-beta-1,6-N-acetylglucosamine synthase-like glycosyltransferase
MSLEASLHAGMLACAVYLTLTYGSYFVLMLSGFYENARRHRQQDAVDWVALARSPFTPGVSVLLAAYNEESPIVASVRSLLLVEYPRFEVIVVNDGSKDDTLAVLIDAFELEPVDRSLRETLETEPVRAFYTSAAYPSLVVVDKVNGGKADALNVGLNVARYPYVCGVDADTVFERDALLRAMRECVADPHGVIGVTSYIEIAVDPPAVVATARGRRTICLSPLLVGFQTLDYLRAFFNNRIAWSRHNFMLCAIGAFQVWRRDVVEEHGGWSRDYTCEDIELTFRLHERYLHAGTPYRIVCLPDPVGATEGPVSVRSLVSQRERWQRVTLETWWAYRHMCFNPRYRNVGKLGMPFYLLSEVLAPFFEVATVVILVTGIAAGLMSWDLLVWTTILIALVNGVFNTGAVLGVDRQAREYRVSSLLALFAIAPLELIVYRPIMTWARIKGTVRYFRGDKGWHKFDRNAPPTLGTTG